MLIVPSSKYDEENSMLEQTSHLGQIRKKRFKLGLAQSESQVREAQRLRYKIFAEEMGARLPSHEQGIDRDIYDPYCEHLLVRDTDSNEVVGTYRILSPERAKKLGGYYSEEEFDLTRFAHFRNRMVEVGRSCVHPDYRSGAVIALLWQGLAEYMVAGKYGYLIGCASISMADGGHMAANIYNRVKADSLSPIEWRVFPRCALPLEALGSDLHAPLPPLIKGYLRLGSYVCGDPAWDPDFNTADLLMLLPMTNLNASYVRHFLGK
jgi:putative hemolysin